MDLDKNNLHQLLRLLDPKPATTSNPKVMVTATRPR